MATHSKVVYKRGTWGNTTLSHARGTIHVVGAVLKEAVKVNACALIAQHVVHICNDPVALGQVEYRQRPSSIDAHNWTLRCTIRIRRDPGNVPVKSNGCSRCYQALGQEQQQCYDKKVGQRERHRD